MPFFTMSRDKLIVGTKIGSASSHDGAKYSLISGELWEPSEVPLLRIPSSRKETRGERVPKNEVYLPSLYHDLY